MDSPLPPFEAGADGALMLPAHGTTVAATALHARLVEASEADHPVEIDASQVESVGQAMLQLLVAARADAEAASRPFAIVNPSTAFTDRVKRCRLTTAIGIDTGDLL